MSFILIFIVPISLLMFVGLCFLQAYLSKRESKLLGWIIPGISFLLSLIWPLNVVYYPAGEVMNWGPVLEMILVLLLVNIPTYVYLTIYFVCREKYRKKNQMNKMNIQDLDY